MEKKIGFFLFVYEKNIYKSRAVPPQTSGGHACPRTTNEEESRLLEIAEEERWSSADAV